MPAIHHIPDCERIPAMYQKIPATYYTKLCEKKETLFRICMEYIFCLLEPFTNICTSYRHTLPW